MQVRLRPRRQRSRPRATCPRREVSLCVHHGVDRSGYFSGAERNPPHQVEARRIDEELGANQLLQLTEIDLRHEHLVVGSQDLARVAWKWIEVPQMRVCDLLACRADAAH